MKELIMFYIGFITCGCFLVRIDGGLHKRFGKFTHTVINLFIVCILGFFATLVIGLFSYGVLNLF